MKISFNPSNSNKNILDLIKNNKDIIFDLKGHSIFARGVEFKGTDTNTWRPVVDNLTSDSTTSSLSAKQGKVLKALIDGKSNSDHNHDGRYVRYYAVTTLDCNNLAAGLTSARISATNAAHTNHSAYLYISDVGTPFQIQIPDSSIPYIYKRYYGSGKWSGWFKLNAGYADSAGSVAWANVTGKPSSYTPSAHTHAWTSITDKIVAGNQFNIVNAGFKGDLWFNYLPINDKSKSATISSYCFGNGNKGYTAVRASGFIKNGGNSEQLLRADGGIATFNWSGQAGQPTWLWGGNDFNSYYVYNPSNFRVAYANSAGNAETLGGMPKSSGQAQFGTIPCIGNDGVMEIGRYIDYHYDNSGKYDFSTRLQTTGNYKNIVSLPSASGTLALVSQVLTWKSQIIDMRSYSESYWHPVTVSLPNFGYNKIKVSVQLNSGDTPFWATHNSGFTCNMEIWATASGWGTTDSDTICLNYTYKFCSQNPCGWMQLGNSSLGVVFLRGGSRYTVYTDFDATFTPHNQKYTWGSGSSSQDTGGPYTSCPGLNFNMGAIRADLIATLVQARRVCAGHDPGIDNSISCSNWFRSSGNTGWYNTTYQGGWYMSDTSWIRAHKGVGIYTGGQIYAGNSIRMGSICLERTNEINSSDDLFINYGSSTNVSLCNGGGNVGIGTMSPTQKLDVNGNITTKGFGIQPCYLSELNLLPTISPGDGYEYKCLEIGRTTDISCIIADKAGLMSERGILIKFNKGYDGQIILLKDLQCYGSGNGYFWVMPSGCNIIKADGSSILVGQNQISNIYDDGHSRFLVYSSLHNVWIEFLCSNR